MSASPVITAAPVFTQQMPMAMASAQPVLVEVDVHSHGKSHTFAKVIAALFLILVLTMFVWMIIISAKPQWFLKNGQIDNTKTVWVSLGIAVVVVIILGILMWAFSRNKRC